MESLLAWLRTFEIRSGFLPAGVPPTFLCARENEEGSLEFVHTPLQSNYASLFPNLIVERDPELDTKKIQDFIRKKKTLPELLYSNYSPFGRPFDQLSLQELITAFQLKAPGTGANAGTTAKPEADDVLGRYVGSRKRVREEAAIQAPPEKRARVPSPLPARNIPSRAKNTTPSYSNGGKRSPAKGGSRTTSPVYRKSESQPSPSVLPAAPIPSQPPPPKPPLPKLPPGAAPPRGMPPLPPGPPPPSRPTSTAPMFGMEGADEDYEFQDNFDQDDDDDFAISNDSTQKLPKHVIKEMKDIVRALINIKDWPAQFKLKGNPFAVKLIRGQKGPVKDEYFDKIKRPMDLTTIKERVEQNYYSSFDHFVLDVKLVADNALEWNNAMTNFHPVAVHFKRKVDTELERRKGRLN